MNQGPWGARTLGFITAMALVAAACVLAFGWQRLDATGRVAAAGAALLPPTGARRPSPHRRRRRSRPRHRNLRRPRRGVGTRRPASTICSRRCGSWRRARTFRAMTATADRATVACSAPTGTTTRTPLTVTTVATRGNDVLREQLIDVAFKAGSHHCDVVAGHFTDPYTGVNMDYATEGSQIHVDHLFPLAAAWDLGAGGWTLAERSRFANDTELELLAVNGSANMSKGDSTPASWLPPAKPYRCEYVTRYLKVAVAYDLAITEADRTAISFVQKRSCPA